MGGASACLGCLRGPMVVAIAGLGTTVGAALAWAARRVVTAAEVRGAIGVGAVLFVMTLGLNLLAARVVRRVRNQY